MAATIQVEQIEFGLGMRRGLRFIDPTRHPKDGILGVHLYPLGPLLLVQVVGL